MSKDLKTYFSAFRSNIIGQDLKITTHYGNSKKVLYADCTVSGRNYKPIEDLLEYKFMPLVANTHTETNSIGTAMTHAYKTAREIIKKHVNANDQDILITCCSRMTGVVNKFQRILEFRVQEKYRDSVNNSLEERPVVFVTHMEHHSNQTSWLETIAEVVIVEPNQDGLVCINQSQKTISKYSEREIKIAAITSCSNVTGIVTNYQEIAEAMHRIGGLCFVDFACSAP